MTMITPSYLGETIEYSSLHACRSTLEDPTVTGAFLRSLSPVVPDDYDLYLRAKGHEDDLLIKPEDKVEVKNGDHFYTSKRVITPGTV